MRFDNGLSALLFFVEKQGYIPYESAMMAKILINGGHGFQYDSNIYSISPWWADMIETMIDLEMIFHMTFKAVELRFVFTYLLGHKEKLHGIALNDPISASYRSTDGRRRRFLQMTAKLDEVLQQHDYLKNKLWVETIERKTLKE